LDRAACSRATFVVCFTQEEARGAAEYIKLPVEKFKIVLMAYQPVDVFPADDGDDIFAGGTQGRDWETLLKPGDGLPYPVRLYTNAKFDSLPPNITVCWRSRREYYEAMAKSARVVLPLEPFRLPGTTAWITTMAAGKPIIVTDLHEAPDYMGHGISGFCYDSRDWKSVREFIVRRMEDRALRLSVGQEAKHDAERFSLDAFRTQILALLSEAGLRVISVVTRKLNSQAARRSPRWWTGSSGCW
jgi:glycosyltransferase involved in cell wall biosynthesis